MPNGQEQFDPVAELKKQYPKIANQSDDQIRSYLSVPTNFRKAFPKYANVPDVDIVENMKRLAKPVGPLIPDAAKQAHEQTRQAIPKMAAKEARDPYSMERLAETDSAVRGLQQFEKWRPRWDNPQQTLQDPTWYGRSLRYIGGESIGVTKAGVGAVLGGYKLLHDLAAIFDPFEGMQHGRTVADPYKQLGRDLSAVKDVGTAAWDLIRHFPEAESDPEGFGNTIANVAMIVDGSIKGAKSFAEMVKADPTQAARVARNASSGTPSRFFQRKAFEDVYVHTKGLDVAKKMAKASKEIHDEVEAHAGGIASQIDTAIPSGVIDASAEAQLIKQEFADLVKFPERAREPLAMAVKAAKAAPGGMWTWETTRQLRSAVGRAMGKVEGPQGAVLTRVYKDLTRKLGGTAEQYGLGDSWRHYNELEKKTSHQFGDLLDDVHGAQSGKEVAAKLNKDSALTKELAENLQKYGLDPKEVTKFAKDSARIAKQQSGWKGTLFRMAYGTPVGAAVTIAGRVSGAPWVASIGAGAVAGYAFTALVNAVRALKLSPEVIEDILSQRELPSKMPVQKGVFPAPGAEPVPTAPTPPSVPGAAAPLPSPPGTTPPAAAPPQLPAPSPAPEGTVRSGEGPGTPIQVIRPEEHGTGKLARQAKARERVAAKRAAEGSTAAGGGRLEVSGGDVARHAQEAQEAQRRAGAPDTDVSSFSVPEMEEALRGLMPKVWDRLQQARRAGKFAEQDYEHYLREVLLRAYEQRAEKMTKPETEPGRRLIGPESGRGPIADVPSEQLPPHVEDLGRKLGVSHFFLGAEHTTRITGQNISHIWRDRVKQYYKGIGLSEGDAQFATDDKIRKDLDGFKGLTKTEKEEVISSLKQGGSVVFISPRAVGRGTAIHEVLHTLTNQELASDLTGPVVRPDEVQQFMDDVKSKDVHRIEELVTENRDWFRRRPEYFTELLTQYFMKNLKEGSKSARLAEAILRSSDNPAVRNLIGTALSVTISFRLAKWLQSKAD